VADRVEIVEGSAFDPLPAGGDGYILSSVLHFMDDTRSLTALRRVRDAIVPSGKLLVVERVIPPGDEPYFGKLLDLTMLVLNGGRERTEVEFGELFMRAGFRLSRVVPLPFFAAGIGLSVVEGLPG
jgi:hypothetical protein